MSTRTAAPASKNRSLLIFTALTMVACAPPQQFCPGGFALSPAGRCVAAAGDAGGLPVGDGGPMLAGDAAQGADAGTLADAAVVELPDAAVLPTDACVLRTWYVDADGDGFGNPSMSAMACSQPTGYAAAPTDCADVDATRHPGVTEICNGQDDDCDGNTDEGVTYPTLYADADGDGYGAGAPIPMMCAVTAGYSLTNTDCDDAHATAHPGGTETCDGLDNNCMDGIDERLRHTYYVDCDNDGFAAGLAGVQRDVCAPSAPSCSGGATTGTHVTETAPTDATNTDCNDTVATLQPNTPYYPDCDGDTYAAMGALPTPSCNVPTTAACSTGTAAHPQGVWTTRLPAIGNVDCYDLEANAYPGSRFSSVGGYMIGTRATWDYDCDGVSTLVITATRPVTTSGPTCSGSAISGTCGPTTTAPAWAGSAPRCGGGTAGTGTLFTCAPAGALCVVNGETTVQAACH